MRVLSIIIPLYNQIDYIEQCISSVQKQDYFDFDIIIVDDGSTDGSGELCDKIAQKDSRITVIHQENRGLVQARFTGLNNCKTEYATFVDSDDFILENAYKSAIKWMDLGVEVISYDIARYFDDNKIKYDRDPFDEGRYDRYAIEKRIHPNLIWNFDKNCIGMDCSLCVRIIKTELLKRAYENSTYNSYFGEDAAIVYPIYKDLTDLVIIHECYYMHRQRVSVLPSYITKNEYFDDVTNLYKHLLSHFDEKIILFRKQIEYHYMYSVELRKKIYNDYHWLPDYLFPFNKVECGKKVVLYGAGEIGTAYFRQVNKLKYTSDLLWVDKNYLYLDNPDIKNPQEIKNYKFDYIVIAIGNPEICDDVKSWLVNEMSVDEKTIVV